MAFHQGRHRGLQCHTVQGLAKIQGGNDVLLYAYKKDKKLIIYPESHFCFWAIDKRP